MSKDIHKNVQALPTQELQARLALYQSLASRGVWDEIMITIMSQELETRNELESAL
jgi:hypothetical protein